MKILCVAEKPSIAKSISEILAGGQRTARRSRAQYIQNYDFSYQLAGPLGRCHADFTMTSVLGHLTSSDFEDRVRKWHSCDPFQLFDARIETYIDDKLKPVAQNLKEEARRADILMIWTDCDREGEHIGQEIVNVCREVNARLRVKRARFSAIIPAQIHRACQNPFELDVRQAEAVDARISLDLRLGAAFTRLQTMTLQQRVPDLDGKVISYGPCQYPTLGFVCDQHFRVQNFVPETFWYISVGLERDDNNVQFKWSRGHLFDFEMAVVLYEICVESPMARVTNVKTKPTQKWKPLPLTTVELQKSGSRLLRLAPKKILDIAEKLYQQGFLSYPRTETDQFDKDFDFMSLIRKQVADPAWGGFAQRLVDGDFARPRNGQKNDKAHPPIHPTAHAGNLQADEKRVYEFVTRRFLACCSTNGEGQSTNVDIEIAGEKFTTSGLVILARNYLEVYPYDKWADSYLPNFQQGEQFMPSYCELKDGQTASPAYLTEADLVGLMDKNGIGTDATIAEHIAKIIEREYVEARQDRGAKYLVPSDLGIGLVVGYNQIGFDRSLTKPHLRRETEHRMQMICDGVATKNEVLQDSIMQYQEVYIKAKREFETVVQSVGRYMQEQPARAIRAGRPAGGGAPRGNRNNNDDNDDDDDDDDFGRDNGQGGGARGRGRGRGRGKAGTTTKARKPAAPRGRGTTTKGKGSTRKDPDDDDDNQGPAPKRPRTSGANTDNTGGTAPDCQCGAPAKQLVVRREGANKGRPFWTCSKGQDEGCGFFEWADGCENVATAPRRTTSAAQNRPAPPLRPPSRPDNEGPQCSCGMPAVQRTVQKAGPNQGKTFHTCSKPQGEQCGFFEWDDPDGQAGDRGRGGRADDGGGQSGDCFKCGQSGHWASACPNEDGGNNRGRSSRGRGAGASRARGGKRSRGR
ncbi:hypothetical protein FFLO_03058 [Filobasidium floriforme]|uniref:DNA topoisomerase n=1 Tax=Filobasidium floriforme TaxID=5210 RepID=A0A8K0JLW5_9TREE|nr:hypothetical protein FFLO_03058 [Filobasidium floriforme]